jgi:hypothetical protein
MRRILIALVVLAVTVPALAQVLYIDDEQITVANTAIGFTAAKITPGGKPQATVAVCRLETAEIRYRTSGVAATSTVGALLEPGDVLTVTGHDLLVNFSAIRTGASSGQLDCTYVAQ